MTEKTAVHTPTKEEYDRLMKAYEKKGWVWYLGGKPTRKRDFDSREGCEYVQFCDRFLSTDLKDNYTIITVDEAIAKLGLYERGQRVLVSNRGLVREERTYLTTIEGAINPHIILCDGDEGKFSRGEPFERAWWKYIKPLEPTTLELTMKDIEDKFGCPVKIINEK